MKTSHPLFRLISLVVAGSMTLAPTLAAAQPAPPQGAPVATRQGDPPARVGRLARISGTVSFHTADEDHWDPATLNYPVTSGNSFWTEPGAEAEIEVSGTRIALNSSTELDVTTLDNQALAATEPQGEVYLRVRDLAGGQTIVLTTPRGVVTIAAPGRYDVVAGDTEHPTVVSVFEGAADVAGVEPAVHLGTNQAVLVSGTDTFQTQTEAAQPDAFVTAELDRERATQRPAAHAVQPPALIAQMSGGEDLDAYGSWQSSPQYGPVWYPQVASGWVPYREGHWAYVAPWGWTWIDNAPWGFAPFHYGRWADIDGRWAWVPAAYAVQTAPFPVYAPALVSFFDPGAAFAAGAAVGAFAGALAVGWLPLGPREVYRPWYPCSPGYLRNVNVRQVQNITTIANTNVTNVSVTNFVNRSAATGVPAAAMAASQPVAAVARPIPLTQLAQARPIVGRVPVPPTAATAGVTPALANRMRLPPPPAGVAAPARPAAPGPAIASGALRPGVAPGFAPLRNNASINGAAPGPAILRAAPASPTATITPSGRSALPTLLAPGSRAKPTAQGGAPGPAIEPRAPGTITSPPARSIEPPAIAGQRGAGPPGEARLPQTPPNAAGPAVSPGAPGVAHGPPTGRLVPPLEAARPTAPHPVAPVPPTVGREGLRQPAFHSPPAAQPLAPTPVRPPQAAFRPPPAENFHPPPVAAATPARPPPQVQAFHPPPQIQAFRPPPQAQMIRPPPPTQIVRPPPQAQMVRPPPQAAAVRAPAPAPHPEEKRHQP